MKNIGNLMKQAQQMQAKMQEMQESLKAMEVTGSSGAGMVVVTMSGKGEMVRIKIDPQLLNGEETEVLEDLIVAACNDAKGKAEERMQEEMAKITGGLNLPPGMSLPF